MIGEYLPPAEVKRPVRVVTQNTKAIIPLSARTAEQLKQKARDLLDFIRSEAQSIDLLEMAYTLQVGRQPMDERLGFVAQLGRATGGEAPSLSWPASKESKTRIADRCKRDNDTLHRCSALTPTYTTRSTRWIANKKLSKLLELWVKGLDLDWSRLYGEVKPHASACPCIRSPKSAIGSMRQ